MRHFLFAATFVLCAATASASDLTLLAPRAGDHLDGGAEAVLVWSATELPAGADEWEAFLSVDGGVYYATRITPHLDAGIRTFRWHVPNVATKHARLLLRIGDEWDEHVIALPQTFTILPRAELDLAPLPDENDEGEAAIPGGESSVEWVSGDRSGALLVRHQRRDTSASETPSIRSVLPIDTVAVRGGAARLPVHESSPHRVFARRERPWISSAVVLPLLLLSTRLNV